MLFKLRICFLLYCVTFCSPSSAQFGLEIGDELDLKMVESVSHSQSIIPPYLKDSFRGGNYQVYITPPENSEYFDAYIAHVGQVSYKIFGLTGISRSFSSVEEFESKYESVYNDLKKRYTLDSRNEGRSYFRGKKRDAVEDIILTRKDKERGYIVEYKMGYDAWGGDFNSTRPNYDLFNHVNAVISPDFFNELDWDAFKANEVSINESKFTIYGGGGMQLLLDDTPMEFFTFDERSIFTDLTMTN